jgi:hypothetical protein
MYVETSPILRLSALERREDSAPLLFWDETDQEYGRGPKIPSMLGRLAGLPPTFAKGPLRQPSQMAFWESAAG